MPTTLSLAEADGTIDWFPATHQASFRPAAPLLAGYYLLELQGTGAGIKSASGSLLDGEYLDANIAGYAPLYGWQERAVGRRFSQEAITELTSSSTCPVWRSRKSGGSTDVAEGGAMDTYTIKLTGTANR